MVSDTIERALVRGERDKVRPPIIAACMGWREGKRPIAESFDHGQRAYYGALLRRGECHLRPTDDARARTIWQMEAAVPGRHSPVAVFVASAFRSIGRHDIPGRHSPARAA